ncbi:MAG: C25 family cysteine peptidase [Chryseolinea sp.]
MKKFLLGAIFLIGFHATLHAQVGNEWIQFGQSYYKISVAKEGIYRLSQSNLVAAGLPSSVDPKSIQIFHRGIEQGIFVQGEGDGNLDAGDYVEFYGQRNDGTLDTELYKPAEAQPHQYYNLYSDTTAYFLTVGSSTGKRMDVFNQTNTSGLTADTFHYDEKMQIMSNYYFEGVDANEIVSTAFDYAEGWDSGPFYNNDYFDFVIPDVTFGDVGSGTPTLETTIIGRGPMQHQFKVLAGTSMRLAGTYTFAGFTAFKVSIPLQWTDIGPDGKLAIEFFGLGVNGQPDRMGICYIKLRYPQKTDMGAATEKVFVVKQNVPGPTLLQIQNPSPGTLLYDVTNRDQPIRIGTTTTGMLNAVLQAPTERKIYAASVFSNPVIKPVSFRQFASGLSDYIIITHALLRRPAAGYSDPVEAYAAYRASVEGGSYDTLTVNTQQLYDQFNYGEPSPLAIFHFMKFLTTVKTPKYLLLAGKGLDINQAYYRRQSAFPVYKDFVPTAGFPGSDMAYTAGLAGTTYEPAVPTGRISATTPNDLAAYLNKVKEMESLPFHDLWRKNILHLSGGLYEGEPQLFKSFMQDFQKVAEGPYLGAKVSALAKQSKEIQLVNIADQLNKGLNLVTFFGHASPSLIDFELGYVTDPVQGYNNKGKYPTLLMNGCQVGSFFLPGVVFGENWQVTKNKGAIGFIGHSSFGFTYSLKKYAETFYEVGYADSSFISKGLGDIQKEVAKRYIATSDASIINITQVQQMVLLGDPAVSLFGAKKADLEITDNRVAIQSFDGQPITAVTDSFAIRMIVRNYGQAPPDTMRIEVQRTLDDNAVIFYDSLYPITRYSDTLMLVIRKGNAGEFGNNIFKITIDPDNVISEYTKDNNTATKSLVISSNGTKNLFPTAYSIVSKRDISLSLQATNLLSDEREFLVELDTAYTFDSPYKKQWKVKGLLLARQQIQLIDADTLAYYWRTKLAQPLSGELDDWTASSFSYIKDGSQGWAQVDFPQYLKNANVGLVKEEGSRRFKFLQAVKPIAISTYGSQYPHYYDSMKLKMSNVSYFRGYDDFVCRGNTLNLVAFDRKSAAPYLGVKIIYYLNGGRTCGREPVVINSYNYTEMITDPGFDLIAYVDNVEVGDSVALFNTGAAYATLWPEEAKIKLGEFGISMTQLESLEDDEPFIIFGRKGDAPGAAQLFKSSGSDKSVDSLTVTRTITGGYSEGIMSSGWIGPALKWDSLFMKPTEVETNDIVSFDVAGIRQNGTQETLFTNIHSNQSIGIIDAKEYPYLTINFKTEDDTYLTTAQLSHWIVTYLPGPEGVLLYNGPREQEQIAEGKIWNGDYGFVNIGDSQFTDSLTVQYEVFNQTQLISEINRIKVIAPMPGDTAIIKLSVSSTGKIGLNDVSVFVNPRVLPEQYYDNNQLQLIRHINVAEDVLNPVLSVAFDGRQLVNGDFVSPNPDILAKIWDENNTMLKTDTAGVRLFVTYPCATNECSPTRILLTDPNVKWSPATDTSVFNLYFTPKALVDGTYMLRVEAADAKGNSSGLEPYIVEFVVKGETTVAIEEPYPNPFTEQVTFSIVITGGVVPDVFDMQLINVNGIIEDSFTMENFPVLHIGTNEVVWNGSSGRGNNLPNGVYIYRINLNVGDKRVQKIGKLVMVR